MIKTENTIIPKYMTIKDIVAYSGIPAKWVRTWIKNGEVDYESFERHLIFLKENNTQAFIINGTTGESSTLTSDEKKETLIK